MLKTHCDICENVIKAEETHFLIYGYKDSSKEAAILNLCVCANCADSFNTLKALEKFNEIRVVKSKTNHHTTGQKEYTGLFTEFGETVFLKQLNNKGGSNANVTD